MKDDSGRVALLWGPLLLVAVLVAVFRFAETGGAGPASPEPRAAASAALPAGHPPGAAVTTDQRPGGEARPPYGGAGPFPGYPAAPFAAGRAPYPGAPACPPWSAYWWGLPAPRPGDHSGRYWGAGAPAWGPPLGEYGPDTQVDPYWWVAAGEADR